MQLKKYTEAHKNFREYFRIYNKIKEVEVIGTLLSDFSSCKIDNVKLMDIEICFLLNYYKDFIDKFKDLDELNKEKMVYKYIYSLVEENRLDEVILYYKEKDIKDSDIEDINNILNKLYCDNRINERDYLVSEMLSIDVRLEQFLKIVIKKEIINYDMVEIDLSGYYMWKLLIIKELMLNTRLIISKLVNLNEYDADCYINELLKDFNYIGFLEEYSKKNIFCSEIKKLKFINLVEKKLIFSSYIKDDNLNEILKRAIINNNNYINKVYTKEILESETNKIVLDSYHYLWFKLASLIKSADTDKIHYIRSLKELLREVPEFNKIIKIYINNVNDEIISKEMIEEKDKLLIQVEQMINRNSLIDASNILSELDIMFKYDGNINSMLGIINFMNCEYYNSMINFGIARIILDDKFEITYNIGLLLLKMGKDKWAKSYLKEALLYCKDEKMSKEISELL